MRPRMLSLKKRTISKLIRLKKVAETDGEYRVAKRLHAVILNGEGRTSGEISKLLQSPRSIISQWIRNYDDYGEEGLLEGHRSGRPSELTENEKQQISDIVESGPVAYGLDSGVWTAKMIGAIIEEEFDISYDPRHVRRILDDLNFSIQRPKRLLANADPKKQNRWRRYTYPNIKKKPKRKGRQ